MTAQLSADSELGGDDVGDRGGGGGGRAAGGRSDSLGGAARRTTRLHLPGMSQSNTRSLFIFSDDNFIRKYAQLIIEWGYPFAPPPYGTRAPAPRFAAIVFFLIFFCHTMHVSLLCLCVEGGQH